MLRLQDLARKRLIQWMDASPKITQTEIGRAIGHNQAWVSKYRLGTMDADIDDLAAMAHVFGHTLTELFDLRPDPRERALLDAFRALTPEKRELSIRMLEAMVPPARGMALELPREHHKGRR
jgi:transcriptional regulator with XRE-family HTH domain